MTTKADFSADEWSTITAAPALAAMFVSAAERGGALRESIAASRAYAAARAQDAGGLLQDVLSSPPAFGQSERAALSQDLEREAPARLRQAIAVLERHTGDDEPAFTGKIALAHLKEFPDYYTRLERMEAEAEGKPGEG